MLEKQPQSVADCSSPLSGWVGKLLTIFELLFPSPLQGALIFFTSTDLLGIWLVGKILVNWKPPKAQKWWFIIIIIIIAIVIIISIIFISYEIYDYMQPLSFPSLSASVSLKAEQFGPEDLRGAFLPAPACLFYDPFIQSTSVYWVRAVWHGGEMKDRLLQKALCPGRFSHIRKFPCVFKRQIMGNMLFTITYSPHLSGKKKSLQPHQELS